MKKLIKRIRMYFKLHALHRRSKELAFDSLVTSPNKFNQVSKEIDCLIKGHKWNHPFDPKGKMDKTFKERLYCTHCGVYFHEHKYKDHE